MEYTEFELRRVRSQKASFTSIIRTCLLELEDDIRDTIKDRWLTSTSVSGGKIANKKNGSSSYARLSYENLKLKKNPSGGGNIDLTFSGSLGDKIKIVPVGNGDYEIISKDSKYEVIGKMYGFEEFGLSQTEMFHFMKILELKINEKI